jgi:phage repressor protein C with HTH and peptisase S24 domain
MVTNTDTIPSTDVNSLVTDGVTVGSYPELMVDIQGDTPGARIAHARKLRGIATQEQLGRLIGAEKQEISRLENDKRKLSADWAERIGRALSVPPETLLYGKPSHRMQSPVGSRIVEVVELDVRAAAGAGLENGDTPEVTRWQVPRALVEGVTTATPSRLRVITIYGDSMEPTFAPGTRVMVDTEDRVPSPPGIFVVHDGLGLVVKRVEFIPKSEPPSIKLSSDNQRYSPYSCALAEAHIQGRVIGRWHWT